MTTQKGCGLGCLTIFVVIAILSVISTEYAAAVLAIMMVLALPLVGMHLALRNKPYYSNNLPKIWFGVLGVTLILAIPLARSIPSDSSDNSDGSEVVEGNTDATETTADGNNAIVQTDSGPSTANTDDAKTGDGNSSRTQNALVETDSSSHSPSNAQSTTRTQKTPDVDKKGIPTLVGPLCDYAGIFTSKQASELEKKLLAFENAEIPAQFVVLTLRKLPEGKTEASYSQEIGEAWGLGQEGVDNGLLLLFALEDRAVFLATGYGMEGDLPDGKCGSLCRRAVPAFRRGEYPEGIVKIVDGVDEVLNHGKYMAQAMATIDSALEGFPGSERFHDTSGHFTDEHKARLTELLEQASGSSNLNLHFLYIPEMHGLPTDQIADIAWERLAATDSQAALLFFSLEGRARGSAVRVPQGTELPKSFNYTLKYAISSDTEEGHYNSVGRVILEFEEAFIGKHPKGWWEFNTAYGIGQIILWIFISGFAGFILLVIGVAIWETIDDKRHPEHAEARRRARASSYSSSSSSYHSSSSSSSHSSYSGGGGHFGGGGGGSRW